MYSNFFTDLITNFKIIFYFNWIYCFSIHSIFIYPNKILVVYSTNTVLQVIGIEQWKWFHIITQPYTFFNSIDLSLFSFSSGCFSIFQVTSNVFFKWTAHMSFSLIQHNPYWIVLIFFNCFCILQNLLLYLLFRIIFSAHCWNFV